MARSNRWKGTKRITDLNGYVRIHGGSIKNSSIYERVAHVLKRNGFTSWRGETAKAFCSRMKDEIIRTNTEDTIRANAHDTVRNTTRSTTGRSEDKFKRYLASFCEANGAEPRASTQLAAQILRHRGIKYDAESDTAFCRQHEKLIEHEAIEWRNKRQAEQQRLIDEQRQAELEEDFLHSYYWRQARMRVLKRDGRRCACCGATPANGAIMNVDHIKPRRLYPELALDENNLQVLCDACNHGKGNWDETDWRTTELEMDAVEDVLYGIAGLDYNQAQNYINQLKMHELQACLLYVIQAIKPQETTQQPNRLQLGHSPNSNTAGLL